MGRGGAEVSGGEKMGRGGAMEIGRRSGEKAGVGGEVEKGSRKQTK